MLNRQQSRERIFFLSPSPIRELCEQRRLGQDRATPGERPPGMPAPSLPLLVCLQTLVVECKLLDSDLIPMRSEWNQVWRGCVRRRRPWPRSSCTAGPPSACASPRRSTRWSPAAPSARSSPSRSLSSLTRY
jgi:hypothetical protein